MNTLDQYMPTMREAPGRLYFPMRASIAAIVSAVLLAGGLTWAAGYPARKAHEAIERLTTYNGLIRESNVGTHAALKRLQGLLAGQPEWLQKAAGKTVETIRDRLADAQPITPQQVLDAAAKQQAAYDKAQALIASSPFRGLDARQVPLTKAGKAYLEALKAEPPARFEYQRLTDGTAVLLKAYNIALKVQDQALNFVHGVDVRLNGDKAAPAPAPVLDPTAASLRDLLGNDSDKAAGANAESVLQQILAADRERERQQADKPDPAPTRHSASDSLGGSFADAARQHEAKERQAQREAEQAKARAAAEAAAQERAAERKVAAEKRAATLAKLKAEKARLEAKQAAIRKARAAKEEAAREKARAAAQAKAAAEAKKRECTSSILARAKCAAQGYNPFTGEKRGH